MTKDPVQFEFLPCKIDRGTSPQTLPPDGARVLQNVDVTSLSGRIRRAPGYARADWAGTTNTTNNVGVINRRDGKKLFIYSDTNGNVNLDVPTTTVDGGGLTDLWNDVDDFVDVVIPNPDIRKRNIKWRENFDEEIDFEGDAYEGPAS